MNSASHQPSLRSRLLRELFYAPFAEKKQNLLIMFAALILLSITQAMLLFLIGPFLKTMFASSSQANIALRDLAPERLISLIPALKIIIVSKVQVAQILPLSIFAIGLLKGFATYIFQLEQQVLALHLGRRYREKLFGAVLALPYGRLVQRSAGEWMSLVMNDVQFIQVRVSDLLTSLVRDVSVVLSTLLALYFVHWPTAVIISIIAIPLTIGTGRTGKRISVFAEGWQLEMARMAGAVLDMRRRFEFIRAQGGEKLEKQRFWQLNQGYYRMIRRSILVRSLFAPLLEFMGFIVLAVILVLVGRGLFMKGLSPSDLLLFFTVIGLLIRPLKTIGEQLSRYHETKGILKESLRTFVEVQAAAQSQPALEAASTGSHCTIDRLDLSYKQGFHLKAEQLIIKPGKSIAIIGPSGGGKSSLLKVFAGLLPPDHWQSTVPWETLQQEATLVSQRPFLFSATMRENLIYGLSGEPPSDAQIDAVLDLVGIRAELLEMGQTLDSRIDFIQTPLSGGQMQRLTIARALLRPAQYLLMDEVTSAIDPVAEGLITLRLIARARRDGQGLLFITHRLSQLAAFDELWFCEQGRVEVFTEVGTWSVHPRIKQFLQELQA